jgi:short-subunit dehydrogenase
MQQLEGRHVVLSGAAGGIGSLVAQRLRAVGARVSGVDRGPCRDCDETIVGNLASPEGIAEVAGRLAGREVDVLVNLAGIQYFGPFERQSADDVLCGYTVNLVAPTLLAQAVVPRMRARGVGQIVNIGSVFGAIPFAHFATYSAAKGGLKALSEALRRELAGSGVRVTHIAPRAVRTRFNNAAVQRFAEITRMNMDAPEHVADRIVAAIARPVDQLVIGFPESLFVRINALAPAMVDRALRANDRKAAALFQTVEQVP